MKIFRKIITTTIKRFSTKFMDKVGSKIISGMADTSSDAPSASYKPKRDIYEQYKKEN
tara:strand:+ start:34 stop:207 length:174 start_codon:yes stop_codon:yes gene_type:complete